MDLSRDDVLGEGESPRMGWLLNLQMRTDIEDGTYSGWDDPRLPTLAGLRKRGTQALALRNFWLEFGIT